MQAISYRTAVAGLWATLLACLAMGAQAAQPTLSTHIPPLVQANGAALVSTPAPDAVMHLAVSLPLRDMAGLDALRRAIADPASPSFRHYLSVAEFTDRFSPSQPDYDTASAYFAAQGLAVAPRAANRMLLDVDGRVADIERVFHVRMGLYRHPTEARLFTAPDRLPTLDLAVPIQQVIGLDDFVRPHPRLVHAASTANTTRTGSGPGGQFTGNDMRKAYYPTGTLTGAGQSVALFEFAGYNAADVTKFFANGYGPANHVPIVGIKTDSQPLSCTGNCDDGEQVLDIEYAISLAPGLSSVRVYVGSIAEDILNSMANENICKIVSSSWGWNENFSTDDAIFKEFAVQGQTNLTASGDNSSLQASGPWPEEDANIIAVGGTDVATSSAGVWSGETGWSGSAGGPSVDTSIKIEPYQAAVSKNTKGASATLRNVPDLALNSDTDMEICANGSCSGGNGGTSFASPMWAGIVAMANQQAVAAGKPVVGFINPAVYALAGGSSFKKLFHDVTKGKSGMFTAAKGYDLVTGIGSPKGQAFIDALVGK